MVLVERRYLSAWLRRTRKQLAPSGRLSEVALILSRREGGSPQEHAARLRAILENEIIPSLDELTSLDLILTRPGGNAAGRVEGGPPPTAEALTLF